MDTATRVGAVWSWVCLHPECERRKKNPRRHRMRNENLASRHAYAYRGHNVLLTWMDVHGVEVFGRVIRIPEDTRGHAALPGF